MKKLFLIFALLCAVSVAQAGQISWSAGQVQASPSTGSYVAGTTVYSAYLYIVAGDVTLEAVKGYLDSGNVSRAIAASSATGTATASASETPIMTFSTLPKYGDFKSETVSAFMIIADAESLDKADDYLVALKNSQAVLSGEFGTSGNVTYAWGSQASNTAWAAVPEPFSGTLALLGLSAIALRRKLKKQKKA